MVIWPGQDVPGHKRGTGQSRAGKPGSQVNNRQATQLQPEASQAERPESENRNRNQMPQMPAPAAK